MHQKHFYYENLYSSVYTDDQFKKSAEKSTNYQDQEFPNGMLINVSCLQIYLSGSSYNSICKTLLIFVLHFFKLK